MLQQTDVLRPVSGTQAMRDEASRLMERTLNESTPRHVYDAVDSLMCARTRRGGPINSSTTSMGASL